MLHISHINYIKWLLLNYKTSTHGNRVVIAKLLLFKLDRQKSYPVDPWRSVLKILSIKYFLIFQVLFYGIGFTLPCLLTTISYICIWGYVRSSSSYLRRFPWVQQNTGHILFKPLIQCFSTFFNLKNNLKIWRNLNVPCSTIYSIFMKPREELAEPRL